jgi:lysophospholipase L1-like esterase
MANPLMVQALVWGTPGDLDPRLPPVQCTMLAEGDSWFSTGALIPVTNLLVMLDFQRSTRIVDCSFPGDKLHRMVDRRNDKAEPSFAQLLFEPGWQERWDAILISGGGNDLMSAAARPEALVNDGDVPLTDRLLLTPGEAAMHNPGVPDANRYFSEPGWSHFAAHLKASFRIVCEWRDLGVNFGTPIFAHTYYAPIARRAGLGFGNEGWLEPGMEEWGIPKADRQGVVNRLFQRLRTLLISLDSASGHADALENFHVFDIPAHLVLDPADPNDPDDSADWLNEIHPNRSGYRKIGRRMGPWIEARLPP